MKASLCVLLILLGRVTVATEPEGPSSIDGFVTGDVATLLPGVAVGANEITQGRYQEAVSDKAGYYLINNLHSGAYSMWAEAKGYGCIIYPNIPVFPGQHVHRNFNFETTKAKARNCDAQRARRK